MGGAGRYWEIVGDTGRYWDRYWQIVKALEILANTGRDSEMLGDVGIYAPGTGYWQLAESIAVLKFMF